MIQHLNIGVSKQKSSKFGTISFGIVLLSLSFLSSEPTHAMMRVVVGNATKVIRPVFTRLIKTAANHPQSNMDNLKVSSRPAKGHDMRSSLRDQSTPSLGYSQTAYSSTESGFSIPLNSGRSKSVRRARGFERTSESSGKPQFKKFDLSYSKLVTATLLAAAAIWYEQEALKATTGPAMKKDVFPAEYLSRLNFDFHLALSISDFVKAKELLLSGADINSVNLNTGYTALEKAVLEADVETVRFLLKGHADVNLSHHAEDNPNVVIFPLRLAVSQHNYDEAVITSLIRANANVNLTDESGNTPLMLAAKNLDGKPAVRLLLKAGTHLLHENQAGEVALTIAAKAANLEVTQYLLRKAPEMVRHSNKYHRDVLDEVKHFIQIEVPSLSDRAKYAPIISALESARKNTPERFEVAFPASRIGGF